MDIKKFFSKKLVFQIIALLAIVILVFILYTVLLKSEDPGTVITTPVNYPSNIPGENASYFVWTKVVKTSSGIFPLKSDSYNVMSVSIAPHAFWFKGPFETGWRIPIKIAGFGATRSSYGLLSANGLKTITLRVDESLDVSSFSTMNLHGEEDYFAVMLSTATDSLHDNTWPKYAQEDVLASSSKPVMHSPDTRTDKVKNRFSTTLNQWQYTDLSGGDQSDAVYAIDTYAIYGPGGPEEIRYMTIFSWGLLHSSRNEIGLRIRLPPDPTTLMQEQLDYYHIAVSTSATGQKYYTLDRIDCEVF
ncbi:MAG: hypothetical protein A4E28_02738 [Methanocella sp. PtaU1.Bin125]|nr:MAG: hypothetical protein A4E28_02738 [Methanocella sp. PtaU1.Bin125]